MSPTVSNTEHANQTIRFGVFQVSPQSGELHKAGVRIKLQEQPFQVLTALLEHPGEIVTREELKRRIWPTDNFGDCDHALNVAVAKLRTALCDSAQSPHLIETLHHRGYRFIAPIQGTAGAGGSPVRGMDLRDAAEVETTPRAFGASQRSQGGTRPSQIAALTAGAAIVLLGTILIFRWLSPLPAPRVAKIIQLTHSGRVDPWGKITSDGARIFFLEREGDHWNLMQAPVSGGEPQPVPSPFHNVRILDLSPDQSEFLVAPFSARTPNLEFWTLPVVGGSPRRLGGAIGDDGAFSRDGQRIAYSSADGIYICSRGGSDPHKIVSLHGLAWELAWSPDGKALRFTSEDQKTGNTSLWEVSADGRNLHPLFPGWNQPPRERGGHWSADGRYYFFVSFRGGIFDVWARTEKSSSLPWSKPGTPVRLTSGPIGYEALALSKDGRQLLGIGGQEKVEMAQQLQDSKQFLTMFGGAQVWGASYSRKGTWIALIPRDGNLWRCRPDGTQRVQLTDGFHQVYAPRWSADETRIVFQGRKESGPWNVYLVGARGGPTEELVHDDHVREAPDWAPNGESVVYSTPLESEGEPSTDGGIYVLNLKTRQTTKVPGSDGLMYARWSFDGRYLAALPEDQKKVMLFDFRGHTWKEIAHGTLLTQLAWSRDAKCLYFQDLLDEGEPLYRVRVTDAKVERVMSFESMLQAGAIRCAFAGLTADGRPLVLVTRGGGDIYGLDLELP
jgi:Tol biopolymer transport system component/DNA-binding winged helix-turn-helix (wHTH) protein